MDELRAINPARIQPTQSVPKGFAAAQLGARTVWYGPLYRVFEAPTDSALLVHPADAAGATVKAQA
ncbi:hypothetical protein [Chthonobacter rhizosphaerae]|uniref:hypothetical protein n=1 Tax=Chthonobacter rhizosphaerae TaxID=2735553 RepID=UPI0015EE9B2B|nr:hypothetical protein [Chthonobacter rhizosphaerae]